MLRLADDRRVRFVPGRDCLGGVGLAMASCTEGRPALEVDGRPALDRVYLVVGSDAATSTVLVSARVDRLCVFSIDFALFFRCMDFLYAIKGTANGSPPCKLSQNDCISSSPVGVSVTEQSSCASKNRVKSAAIRADVHRKATGDRDLVGL